MSDTDAINTKVARIRERYRNAVNEVREDANRQVKETREASELEKANLKKAYTADKQKLSEENQKTMQEYSKDISEKMDRQTDRFKSEVRDLKREHNRERYETSRDFSQRLEKVADDYRTKESLTDARNAEVLDQAKKNADSRMRRDAIQRAKEHEMFTSTTRDKMRELLDLNASDLREVSDRHSKELLQVNEYNLREKNRIRGELGEYINELKSDKKTEREQMLKEKNEAVGRVENAKKLERQRLESEFSNSINNLSDKAEKARQRTETNLLNQLNFERKLAQDNTRKNNNIVNDMVETTKTNNKIHENSLSNAKAKMDQAQKDAADRVLKNSQDFVERYDDLDRKHQKSRMDEKTRILANSRAEYNDLLHSKIDAVNREKRDGRIMINRYQQQLRGLQRDTELKVFETNQQAQKQIEENNHRHHDTLNAMTEKNQQALAEFKAQAYEDKTNLVEATRDRIADQGLALRKQYGEKISKMEADHSKKVEKLQKTLDDTISKYENLLRSNQQRNSDLYMDFQKTAQTEQKLLKNEFIQQMKDKEVENKYNMDETRKVYEQKLAEAKDQSDLRIMELTNRYENEIATERKNFYRVLKQKMSESQRALQSLSQRMDAEKKSLRMQMESRITDLQNENRKIRQLNVQRQEYLDKIEPEDLG